MAIAVKDTYTFDEFAAEMEQAARAIDELPVARDLTEKIIAILYEGIAINFALAESADGVRWLPHAPSTVKRYGPHPLLILTGAMVAASTSSGAEGSYLEVHDRQLVIGNTLEYAATQQFGDQSRNIPARPFFDPLEESIDRIEDAAVEYYMHEVIG